MSVGFRKSIFGFNCDDVMSYIEKTHKEFREKETVLSEQLDEIKDSLESTRKECAALTEERDSATEKLNSFTDKYDEIEKLSENIGKLYLVAQANAKAIVANSEESARLSEREVGNNLYSIDEAHASLSSLRESIMKTSEEFAASVDALIGSLADTKQRIEDNTHSSSVKKDEFEEIIQSMSK